ncbi:hypothetical protein LSTR_LSTR012502 [Laodelphax striatellus]|uniref:Death ligand signal enhancer n=1 Tax=Laodelphax striatellus TaxID=195883 RepID=A0A482XL76_LAOST|nr:hypothetical protein LSTR_LSTR012502 [Laodelphax striatellus]
MWKTLARGLRAPFERSPWSNRTSGEQSTAPNNQENKFHLPCPFRLIPSLLEKCQTYPYLPFCPERKQNQQGADSEGRTDESCKNETFYQQPCGLLGAVGWSGVLVLGWTILQPWYRHDTIRRHQPKLHADVKQNVKGTQTVNLSRYQSLYRLLINPAFSQPILPAFSTTSASSSTPSSSSFSSSVDSQSSVSSSSLGEGSIDYFNVAKESSSPDRQLTPDEAFDQAAEEVRMIHERLMGASENRQGVACMSLSQNREAIEHFRVASQLQYAPAAFNLGQCYELGIGTEQDFTQAAHWYQKASDLGHPIAMYNLGVFYAHGWGGLVANSTHARNLFTRAAKLGQAEAQAALDLKASSRTTEQPPNAPPKNKSSFSTADFLDFPRIPKRNELEISVRQASSFARDCNRSSLPSLSSSFSSQTATTPSSASSSCDHSLSYTQQRIGAVKESTESLTDSTCSDDEWDLDSVLDRVNGNSATLYRLAVCYEKNPEEEQDPELVFKLYQMAADHGHEKAKRYLKVLEHHRKLGTLADFLEQRKRSRTCSSTSSDCALKN